MIKKQNKGFGFIEIILVTIIILFVFYQFINLYFKKSPVNARDQKILTEETLDTSSYKKTLDSVKAKVNEVNSMVETQDKEMENYR